MPQLLACARTRASRSRLSRLAALVMLAAAIFAFAQSADAVMKAAVGLYRPSISRFMLDGNFDHVSDYKRVFGVVGDTGLLCDITGSGARSPAIFRGGAWYFDLNRDGVADMTVFFGAPGDKPLCADMDGDGRDDIVLYRGGNWYVALNPACPSPQTSCGAPGSVAYGFGAPGDTPLLADVNGDGQLDLIVYRAGAWYVSTTRGPAGTNAYGFGGLAGDEPLAFDYDGDGLADLVIFRNGNWYVSTNRDGVGTAAFVFGTTNDKPLYFGPGAVSNGVIDPARLLYQATFGPTPAEIGRVQSMGINAWVDDQLNVQPKTSFPVLAGYTGAPPTAPGWWPQSRPNGGNAALPYCAAPNYSNVPCRCDNDSNPSSTNRCDRDNYSIYQTQRTFWRNALTAPDQLRLRVAWALSQILVTSAQQDSINYANRDYQQILRDNAFGRFEDLLFAISANSFMGNYLDMANNRKASPTTSPNENYAREIMQLFSIGLFELNPDGSLILDATLQPIPTYDQVEITELAKVFTGWTYWPRPGVSTVTWNAPVNYTNNMVPCESTALNGCGGTTNYHDITTKDFLGYSMPAGGRADPELRTAVGVLANHPNVGPFIGKQLIQHLVTSNPSPAYVNRISQVWANDGTGVRGNLKAVVRAILLDPEARAPRNPVYSTFGKLKEPVLHVTNFLRSLGAVSDGVYLINARVTNMGEDPFNSPTVFNFYPADYVIPGTSLAGPQFGILDATTYFSRANFVYSILGIGSTNACTPAPSTNTNLGSCAADPTVASSVGTKIDLSIMAGMFNNVPQLVDFAANALLFEPLPPAWRTLIINAVNAIPVSSPATAVQMYDRARMAVYLIAISPKYQAEY